MLTSRIMAYACCWALAWSFLSPLSAYEPAASALTESDAKPDASKAEEAKPVDAVASLPDAQQRLAEQYRELERVLMVMRDLTRQSDPNRAALIEKALKESGDRQVDDDLQRIVDSLKTGKLSTAMDGQSKLDGDLQAILELLLTETRPKRLEDEKSRYRKYLERVSQILREQKDQLGRNAAGGDAQSLSGEQGALAEKTAKLAGEIRKNEEKQSESAKPGEKKTDADKKGDKNSADKNSAEKGSAEKNAGKGSDSKPGDKAQPGDKGSAQDKAKNDGKPIEKNADKKTDKNQDKNTEKPGDKKNDAKSGNQGQGQPNQGQPSQGQPSQGQPSEGQPNEGQQQDSQQPQQQDENPARKRLDAARQHMEEARDKLKKAERSGSMEDQKKAIAELEQAKAALEEILRQLREEEMRRLLAMLEARFVKILQMQREIYDNTVRLDKVALAERSHSFDIESGKLSAKQTEILVEVDSALRLLREEGSAVAFPEAVEQIRQDMEQVMQRLARSKTGDITQEIEKEIILGLEQIVDALKKARKDAENKKQPPGPSQNGQPQDPPLIEMLSELKMIRSMQERINRRTANYSQKFQGEQADKEDMLDALQRLGIQQERVYRVTRDLELGKNQ